MLGGYTLSGYLQVGNSLRVHRADSGHLVSEEGRKNFIELLKEFFFFSKKKNPFLINKLF